MTELRWKLKTFRGKAKERTGYVLEHCVARMGIKSVWESVTIEGSDKTLVFDQYPLGQAVPLIMEPSALKDHEEPTD
jgi:hypothetical protein